MSFLRCHVFRPKLAPLISSFNKRKGAKAVGFCPVLLNEKSPALPLLQFIFCLSLEYTHATDINAFSQNECLFSLFTSLLLSPSAQMVSIKSVLQVKGYF